MPGPEMAAVADKKKESAAAATIFGEGIVEPRGARASSSSSSSLSSCASSRSRRHGLVVAKIEKDMAVAAAKKHEEARSPERTAVAALSRRQPRKSPAAAMKRDEEVRSRETTAVAVISRRQPRQRDIEVRSPKRSAVAAISRRQPRGEEVSSPKRTAVAASRKRQPRRSSPSPPPPPFVTRKNIKPRRDLEQKERVRQCDFGYSSSGDQRACRSGGTRVRVHASIPQSRHAAASIPQSVQPASRSRGMHTREQARGSLALQNKRQRRRYQESISIDSRDVSLVEARRPCKPLPESSSSESPPKRSSVQLVSARATRERREIRNRLSSPQLRRQLRDFEEPAEPSQWRPQAAFGAESITQALPQSWSQRPHRIGNLIFGTSYVSDLAAIARFQEWLTKSPIHCHVVLCQTHNSAVAEWLQNCGRAESASFHVLLESKRVIYITARVFMVLLRRHVEITAVRQALAVEEIDFAVVEIKIYQRSTASVQGGSTAVAGRRTAVAVGIVHVMPSVSTLPEWLMNAMYESVHVHVVRCFTGTFGVIAAQMRRLVTQFPMATPYPVCQMWRGIGVCSKCWTPAHRCVPCVHFALGHC